MDCRILGLLCVHLLDSRAGTEREKEARPKDAMIIARFIIFSSLYFAAAGAIHVAGPR